MGREGREVRALRALLAEAEGETLTKPQAADCLWYRKKTAKDRMIETVGDLTKADYLRLSGVREATLIKQISRHQLPMDGKVDLCAVLRRLHEILTETATAKPEVSDQEKQLKCEQLEKRIALLDMDIRQRRGDFIERAELGLKLDRIVGRLSAVGASLGKKFGPDAQRLLNEGMESIAGDFDGNSQLE